jgi:hypothetical protein|tara:strand:- start:631 stop:909 length:279 start_codon:yes stop_codon:yes gene_type:complete
MKKKRRDTFFWGVKTPAQMRTRLKSMLETMEVSKEVDVKKPNDLTWLRCNLREQNKEHPFIDQAVSLCGMLLKTARRNSLGSTDPSYRDTFE